MIFSVWGYDKTKGKGYSKSYEISTDQVVAVSYNSDRHATIQLNTGIEVVTEQRLHDKVTKRIEKGNSSFLSRLLGR